MHKITTKRRSKPRWVSTQGTKNKNKSKRKKKFIFFYDLKSCKKRNESERGAYWTWSRMTAAMTMVLLTALPPLSPAPPAPSRLEAGGLILHSFSLCEIRRFFLSFHSLFFSLCSLVGIRIRIRDGARHETCSTYWDYTVAQKSSFGARLSRCGFYRFFACAMRKCLTDT